MASNAIGLTIYYVRSTGYIRRQRGHSTLFNDYRLPKYICAVFLHCQF